MKNLTNLILLLTCFSFYSQSQVILGESIVTIPQFIYQKSNNYINLQNLENDTVSVSIYSRWGEQVFSSYNNTVLTEDNIDIEIFIDNEFYTEGVYYIVILINDQNHNGIIYAFDNFKREVQVINNLVLSNEQLNLEIKGYKNDTIDVTILNTLGQIISSDSNLVITEDSTNHYIDTYTFPAGVYILAVDSQYIKFVIESGPVSIENKLSKLLTIFPNPTSDILFINTDYEIISTEIYNLKGKMIHQSTYEKSILVNKFPKGVYLIKITAGNHLFEERILIN